MDFKPHPEYQNNSAKWKRCRDAIAGQDEVKRGGEAYAPKPSSQYTDQEYKDYLARGLYFNASGRTLDAFLGLMFRVPPVIEAPVGMEGFVADCTQTGLPLEKFARHCADEVLQVGRAGVLVDYPMADPSDGMTLADVQAINLRPRFAFYPAESIENWKSEWRLNRYVTVCVQLIESEKKRRVLILDESNVYRVQEWEKEKGEKGQEEWMLEMEAVPLMNGQPLSEIPFFILDAVDGSLSVDNPPLLDLVDVNISHWQTMLDLEQGRKLTAQPTFFGKGFTTSEIEKFQTEGVRLGAGNSLMSSSAEADVKMLEFTGAGLGALENAATQKQEMMSLLGTRALISQGPAQESGEAKAIERAGEDSVLAALAWSISNSLTQAMQVARDWYNLTGEAFIQINTRFYQKTANPQELVALMGQVQSGLISRARLWAYMQERDLMPRDMTLDQVTEEIEGDGVSLGLGQ